MAIALVLLALTLLVLGVLRRLRRRPTASPLFTTSELDRMRAMQAAYDAGTLPPQPETRQRYLLGHQEPFVFHVDLSDGRELGPRRR